MLSENTLNKIVFEYQHGGVKNFHPEISFAERKALLAVAEAEDVQEMIEAIEKKLNSAVFPGSQGGPLMHVVAAKAVCFKEALEPEFKTYIKQVMDNAKVMCSTIQSRGINVVTGKTENHIILVDLRNKEITGKELEKALGDVNITVNKNAVPDDPRSPFVTSGVRLGTPAVTTRGFKEEEVEKISNWICDVIENHQDISKMDEIKNSVIELTSKYPVYNL